MKELSKGVVRPRTFQSYRVPGSTYRLQLNQEFTFRQALEITEYLHQLGITDCYASPLFTARPGSTHGYDVCNCSEFDPQIGTAEDFDRWSERLQSLGMGLLLDIVPNHMGAHPTNPWWRDVLEQGEESQFARWFDIDWRPTDERLAGKVLLAVLEDRYARVLEAGKLQVVVGQRGFELAYHETRLPLSPKSLEFLRQQVLRLNHHESPSALSSENLEAWPELKSALNKFNGMVGHADSFDQLHELLQMQNYRLAYWRIGNEELNYRRFFDVSELVALRMELPEVFQATHELVLRLVHQHKVTGLRIDHPDGLWDPRQYFIRLQQACDGGGAMLSSQEPEANQRGGAGPVGHHQSEEPNQGAVPLYVVAEKILTGQETLPADWPVAGTTGYDFLNLLNGLFVNGSNCAAMDEVYAEFTGVRPRFRSQVNAAKRKILQNNMRADLRALSGLLQFIASRTRYGIDFASSELQDALAATIAAFPVYRTYLTEQSAAPTTVERSRIEQAIESARIENSSGNPDVLAFVKDLLLLSPPADLDEAGCQACRRFVMKFQQLSGPVMAKGLEDTMFYNFNRLISLNDVGGDPESFGPDLELFHRVNRSRAERWPNSLLTTATHDTKRGEDLRARINVLSEMPDAWRQAVLKWGRLNAQRKVLVEGQAAPDANDEYFLYQTLVGAWVNEAENGSGSNGFRERISNYMLKAIREAKAHTSWIEPNAAYERATQEFIESILTHSHANPFLDDFMLFHRNVAFFGLFNSLAQIVLKMTAPGVPDFYQGTELWDYSLVDPDNRRPVDFQTRKALLTDLEAKFKQNQSDMAGFLKALFKNYQTGKIKLYLIWRILKLRRNHSLLFQNGEYVPIQAAGSKRDHICAFARTSATDSVITVAARLVLGLTNRAQRGPLEPDVWQDTTLPVPGGRPGDRYLNVLTGQVGTLGGDGGGLAVRELLALLPVAVLQRIN